MPPPAGLQSLAAEGESTHSSGSALTAPALGFEEGFEEAVELSEAELAAVLEDELANMTSVLEDEEVFIEGIVSLHLVLLLDGSLPHPHEFPGFELAEEGEILDMVV